MILWFSHFLFRFI